MRVKNMSGEEQVWVGQTLADGAHFDIPASQLFKWQDNDDVIADLSAGDLEIGDGTTYKTPGAQAIQFLLEADTDPKDQTGRRIVRGAVTQDGWHAQFHSIDFTVGVKNSVYNKDEDGNDLGFATLQFFKEDGTDISDQSQATIALQARKTVLKWMPNHDYGIVGGKMNQTVAPADDIYMYATGLPGIADKKFAQGGLNLKRAPIGSIIEFDGGAAMELPYNGGAGTNRFSFAFKHSIAATHDLQLILRIYKA